MTQAYGVRDPSYVRGYHAGIDFGCPVGTPVYCASDGIVRLSAEGYGDYGKLLVVEHIGDAESWYAHLSRVDVRSGPVSAGQVIALSGATGRVTGPHLHFEYRVAGEPVDPAPYLEGA